MSRLQVLIKSLFNKLESTGEQIIVKDLLNNKFPTTSPTKDKLFISAYTDYIASQLALRSLYGKYAKGERSIEETAKIVGLKLPQSTHKF